MTTKGGKVGMSWHEETPWWVWGLWGLCLALLGVFYLMAAIEAYPKMDAEGYVPMPSRGGTVRHPWHFALGCPLSTLALAIFLFWKAYKALLEHFKGL